MFWIESLATSSDVRSRCIAYSVRDNLLGGQRLDLLVAGEVVVEIKSSQKLPSVATSQVLSYLKATGLKRGLLLNFGQPKLTNGITRISL